MRLLTIGVYGTTEESFFNAIASHKVTDFVDVRARRGLRGDEHRYANHKALVQHLNDMGVRYHHRKDLAPDEQTRKEQERWDKAAGIARRARATLSPEFRRKYYEKVLRRFDPREFINLFAPKATVVLFCVEGPPAACHRSLLANAISSAARISWRDITPTTKGAPNRKP